jgi:hypothetical protein
MISQQAVRRFSTVKPSHLSTASFGSQIGEYLIEGFCPLVDCDMVSQQAAQRFSTVKPSHLSTASLGGGCVVCDRRRNKYRSGSMCFGHAQLCDAQSCLDLSNIHLDVYRSLVLSSNLCRPMSVQTNSLTLQVFPARPCACRFDHGKTVDLSGLFTM